MLNDIKLEKIKNLEFGANIQQIAQIYEAQSPVDYEVLSDTELSYEDFLNLKTGLDITSEFYDVKAVSIVKAAKISAAALGSDILDAFQKALDCDPLGALGACLVFSDTVDENLAAVIRKTGFKIVAAPDFTQKSAEMLLNSDNLKIVKIKTSLENYRKLENYEVTTTPFGILVQSQDRKELDSNNFKVVSKTKPTAEQIEDAVFAWKIAKHVKSEAVVIVKDFKTLAISQGYTNRINAFEHAVDYACNDSKDAILSTDGQILSVESINAAVQGRIGLIIQSGNSPKPVLDAVNKYNLVMIETGITHNNY